MYHHTDANDVVLPFPDVLMDSLFSINICADCLSCTESDFFFLLFSQSQKEELDSALSAVAASGDAKGKADLELENTKLKKELLSLPELKTELESLRARVTELSQLTGMMWHETCRESAH